MSSFPTKPHSSGFVSVPPQLGHDEPLGEPFYSIPFSSKTKVALQLDLESMGIRTHPLDLLVSKEERPTRSSRIRTHSAGLLEYPGWLMRVINRDTFTCGPELVFIQLAMKLPLIDAVVLGYELCGAYSHFAGNISGFYDRPPLTSVAAISEAIRHLEGLRGIKKAEAALRWVRDGARSPMETVLSCCLSLPAVRTNVKTTIWGCGGDPGPFSYAANGVVKVFWTII